MHYDPPLARVLGGDDRAALLVYQVHHRCQLKGGVNRDGEHWIWEKYEGWLTPFASWGSVRAVRRVVERARDMRVLVTKKSRDTMLYRVDYDALRQLFMAVDIPVPDWVPESDPSPVTLDMMVEVDIQQTAVAAWEETDSRVPPTVTHEEVRVTPEVTTRVPREVTTYGSHKLISLLDTHTQPKSKHIRHTLLASSEHEPSDFLFRFCKAAGERDRGYEPMDIEPTDWRLKTLEQLAAEQGEVNAYWGDWLWCEIEDMCDRGRRPHTSLGMATAIFQRMVANGHDLSAEPPEPTERLIQSSARY